MRDRVERDVVDAKSPNEIVDVVDMLLVRLGGKECLEKPFTIMDLSDVTHFFERSNAFTHYRNFTWSIMDLLDSNRTGGASINRAGVVTNREELALIVEDRPVFLEQLIHEVPGRAVEVAVAEAATVQFLAEEAQHRGELAEDERAMAAIDVGVANGLINTEKNAGTSTTISRSTTSG